MPLRLSHRYFLEGSKNPVLQEIVFLVDRYNREFHDAPAWAKKPHLDAQAAALAGLAYRAGAYMTSKPPQRGKLKNKARWDAMSDLMADLMKEAQRIGVKMVRSPADFRTVDLVRTKDKNYNEHVDDTNASIWLEVLDPRHRHAFNLSEIYSKWLKTPGKQSFWDYVGTKPAESVQYFQGQLFYTQFEGERLLAEDREPVHTAECHSIASGKGWAIFVYSPDHTLYVHEHERDIFHHSTFLGGGAVLAAGEIVADQGRVVGLTAKTGHYWTTPELMLSMARQLRGIPDSAIIRPDVLDLSKGLGVRYYRMKDYRAQGSAAAPLNQDQIRLSLPNWVKMEGQIEKAPPPPGPSVPAPPPPPPPLPKTTADKKAEGYVQPL